MRLDEDPDGVPHDIVMRSTIAAYLLAFAALLALATVGWFGAALVAIVAIPLMTIAIGNKAARERGAQHK